MGESNQPACPQCGSTDVTYRKSRQDFVCNVCDQIFTAEREPGPESLSLGGGAGAPPGGLHLKVFLSYGHDANEPLVRRIQGDLAARGHDVWVDKAEIKAGDDWRRDITDSILGSDRVVAFLSKHSTRDPGVCLDEIAIAVGVKGGNIQTVLAEAEGDVQPPATISYIQWLDMHDWKEKGDMGESAWESWYKDKIDEIVRVLESQESARFAGEIEQLKQALAPISPEARLSELLRKPFVGRAWLADAVEEWRAAADPASRVFWIVGAPGVGKSAFAANLAHREKHKVVAVQFCEHDKQDHRDARRVVRTLAFQLATRLPDYRKFLLGLPEIRSLGDKEAAELFDYLLANPLRTAIDGQRERCLILIDALDEASERDRNPLAEMLARNAPRLPPWLGIVVTSRPETPVTSPLQGLNPLVLDTETEANRADIREFLQHELASRLETRADAGSLVETILDKSEGVFLYADLVCRDVLGGTLSLDAVDQFPQGLGGVYFDFFSRQFPDPVEYATMIRPLLEVVAAAREPVPVATLDRVLGWNEYARAEALRRLGSLFPSEGGRVRPSHKSMIDWLVDPAKAGPQFFIVPARGHETLAAVGWEMYCAGPRRLDDYLLRHLPHHLLEAKRPEDASTILADLAYVERRVAAGQVDDFLRDYEDIRLDSEAYTPAVAECHRFLQADAHVLRRDPSLCLQQALNQGESARLEQEARALLAADPFPHFEWVNKPRGQDPCRLTLAGQTSWVTACAWSPDGATVLSASYDATLKLWDAATGAELRTLAGHSREVTACAWSPDGSTILSASGDNTLKLWNAATGAELRTLAGHAGMVKACAWSPDGATVLSASGDALKLWDAATGAELRTLAGHASWVHACTWSPDGATILSASADRTLKLWDATTGEELRTLTGHAGAIRACAWSPDGATVLSASADRTLKLWDAATGEELRTLAGHADEVWACAWSPDGATVLSASWDRTLKLWDAASGAGLRTLAGHEDLIRAFAWSPDGATVLSASDDKTLKLWDAATGEELRTLAGHADRVEACAWSPDGLTVLSTSWDHTLKLWDAATGEELRTLAGHADSVWACAWSPDGAAVLSASHDKTLKLWDAATGAELRTLAGHSNEVWACAWSPDGTTVLSASDDETLKLWDPVTGAELRTLAGHTSFVKACAWSPDGTTVLSASWDKTLKLWDPATGAELRTLAGHLAYVNACAWSPDGVTVISASNDTTLKVWDAATGECLRTLAGHTSFVKACAWSPDGVTVISASDDKTLKLWDAATGNVLATFPAGGVLQAIATDRTGQGIAAGDFGGTVYILRLRGLS